jgi:outer membrane protein assembly factor BamB
MSGSKSVTSYDPRTGNMWWYMDGPTEQFVASMVDNGELVFLTAGFPEHHILAIRPDGTGTISDSHIMWRTTRYCSYVPSPIVMGNYFLVAADNGVASCYDADSGELQWVERLGKQYSASLVACNGLVYFVADDGETKVVRPGKALDIVAENLLGENCFASPAISNDRLFVRGEQHLYCIE